MRYYPLPGGGTAVRTGTGNNYGFELTDQHATPTVYLDATAQNPTWRQYTPYGDPRGTPVTAPDNRGFLNKPLNPTTGLTQLGARNYDPGMGRFISVDPVLETTDPNQLGGYTYAADNPITASDPDGLCAYADGDLCISHGTDFGKIITNGSGHDVTSGDRRSGGFTKRDNHDNARSRFFTLGNEPSGSLRIYAGGAGLPDRLATGNGILVMRIFIANRNAGFGSRGDGRGFSVEPNAGFRVAIAWDTDTGDLVYESTKSCYLVGRCGGQSLNDATVFVAGKSKGTFGFTYGGRDALAPRAPAVNGKVSISFDGKGGARARVDRDAYPSLEVIQYRQGQDPRFLVRDGAGSGGPLRMISPMPNSVSDWIDGARVH